MKKKVGLKSDAYTVNFRQHIEKFSNLDEQTFIQVLQYFDEMKLRKGDFLIETGNHVHKTYWVIAGLLVSRFTDDTGKDHIIQFATENCWITDQHGFYNQQRASFTIEALEPCQLLALSYDNREKLCETIPRMANFFRRKANDSFVKQQNRMLTYMTADAKKRYELLINEYPNLVQRVSKKTIAAYLGISRETLSRL